MLLILVFDLSFSECLRFDLLNVYYKMKNMIYENINIFTVRFNFDFFQRMDFIELKLK